MQDFGSPLDSFLDPGERLLWSGQPKQGVRLQPGDALMIPFSLMWGGFAIFWEIMALGIGAHTRHANVGPGALVSYIFPLWGIPFVLIGLYMIFGRFFYDAASRKKTWYGVTDRRLIVMKLLFNSKVNSYDYLNLTNLNLVERADRSGDILFGTPFPMASFSNASWPGSGRYAVPGFYLLPNAREVFSRIQAAQQAARK